MVISFALMAWAMSGFWAETQQFAVAHPEATTITTSPGSYSIEIDGNHPNAPMPDFGLFFSVMGLTVVLMVGLLAAAVSRRLHDRNLTALLGLLPVVFMTFALIGFLILMNNLTEEDQPNFGMFIMLFLNNIFYMISLVALIVILAFPGTKGPNQFGDEPVL